jgi:cytidine deaminase
VKQKKISISFTEFSGEAELPEDIKNLAIQAKKAADNAYAPYSKFKVGAAVLLANGKIITGNNQENSAYPSGICAERVAIFYANAQYPKVAINAIAIVAFHNNKELNSPVYPCGSCRQVITESQSKQKNPIKLYFIGQKFIHGIDDASHMLPLEFDKESLNS